MIVVRDQKEHATMASRYYSSEELMGSRQGGNQGPICRSQPAGQQTVEFRIAGVTHGGAQDVLAYAYRRLNAGRSVPVRLVAEPTNPHDPHAVRVLLGVAGRWVPAGYVPASQTRAVRQYLRGGYEAKLVSVGPSLAGPLGARVRLRASGSGGAQVIG